jgi:hypothetical protein
VFADTDTTGPTPLVRATQPACVGLPSDTSACSVVSIPNTPNSTLVLVALMYVLPNTEDGCELAKLSPVVDVS